MITKSHTVRLYTKCCVCGRTTTYTTLSVEYYDDNGNFIKSNDLVDTFQARNHFSCDTCKKRIIDRYLDSL